jgi:hypothetical protein
MRTSQVTRNAKRAIQGDTIPKAKREFPETDNLHLLLLALLFEVSGVLSGSHFLLLDVMMMFFF